MRLLWEKTCLPSCDSNELDLDVVKEILQISS